MNLSKIVWAERPPEEQLLLSRLHVETPVVPGGGWEARSANTS